MTEITSAPVSAAPIANASPKKMIKKSTKGKSTNGSTHPKYSDMIKAALKSLNDRTGSSRAAILKFVLANYHLDPNQANQHLKLALKNGVKAKFFKQTKGNGASGSFKLNVGENKPIKKKLTKTKKVSGTKKTARPKTTGTKTVKKVVNTLNNSAVTPATGVVSAIKKAKVVKPKTVGTKKPKTGKTTGVKKTSMKKTVKPKVVKATKPKVAGTKKTTGTKKVSKPKVVKKVAAPKKAAK